MCSATSLLTTDRLEEGLILSPLCLSTLRYTHTHTRAHSSCISLCPFPPSCFTLKPSYFTSLLLRTGTWTLLSILLQEFKLYSESHQQMQSTYFVQIFRREWCFLKFGADASHLAKVIVSPPSPFFLPPLCNSSTFKRHFIAQTHATTTLKKTSTALPQGRKL